MRNTETIPDETEEIFAHGTDALYKLHEFYDRDIVIFIEGITDRVPWEIFLNKYTQKTYELIEVYGVGNFNHYIDEIIKNDTPIVVITDRDYREFQGNLIIHQRIIYSEGYSIENSLFTNDVLRKVIYTRANGRLPGIEYAIVLAKFLSAVKELIILDILNRIEDLNYDVLSDSSLSVSVNKNPTEACPNRISALLKQYSHLRTDYPKTYDSISISDLALTAKGKWLLGLVRAYIIRECEYIIRENRAKYADKIGMDEKAKRKFLNVKYNITYDDIYSNCILSLENLLNNGYENGYYKEALSVI